MGGGANRECLRSIFSSIFNYRLPELPYYSHPAASVLCQDKHFIEIVMRSVEAHPYGAAGRWDDFRHGARESLNLHVTLGRGHHWKGTRYHARY